MFIFGDVLRVGRHEDKLLVLGPEHLQVGGLVGLLPQQFLPSSHDAAGGQRHEADAVGAPSLRMRRDDEEVEGLTYEIYYVLFNNLNTMINYYISNNNINNKNDNNDNNTATTTTTTTTTTKHLMITMRAPEPSRLPRNSKLFTPGRRAAQSLPGPLLAATLFHVITIWSHV